MRLNGRLSRSEKGGVPLYIMLGLLGLMVLMVALVVFKMRRLNAPPPGGQYAPGITASPQSSVSSSASASAAKVVENGIISGPAAINIDNVAAIVPKAKMVQGDNYTSAAAPPRPLNDMIDEMAGDERKPAGVPMSDELLEQKIYSPSLDRAAAPVRLAGPVPGQAAVKSDTPLIKVGVEAERIASAREYDVFSRKHKGRALPKPNFTSQMLIVLVSKDAVLPNRIFEIADVKGDDSNVYIKYRVNPFEARKTEGDYFASTVVKKSSKKIVLEQIM